MKNTTQPVEFTALVRNGQIEEARHLFFDDAHWVITSPMVNVAQRLVEESRKKRPEACFAPVFDTDETDVVPMTVSREQAIRRRVQRAVTNNRQIGNTYNLGWKPF